jgi:hypothetical protein
MKIFNALTNRENYMKNLDMKISLNNESKHIEYQPYNQKIEQRKYYVNDNVSTEGVLNKFKENLSSVVNPLLIGPILNNPLFDNNYVNQQYINDRWYAFYNLLIQNFTTLNLSTFIDFCIYFLNMGKMKYKSNFSSNEISQPTTNYAPINNLISSSVNPVITTPTIAPTTGTISPITGTTTTTVPPVPPILPGPITGTTTTTVPPVPPILPGPITGTTTTTVPPITGTTTTTVPVIEIINQSDFAAHLEIEKIFELEKLLTTEYKQILQFIISFKKGSIIFDDITNYYKNKFVRTYKILKNLYYDKHSYIKNTLNKIETIVNDPMTPFEVKKYYQDTNLFHNIGKLNDTFNDNIEKVEKKNNEIIELLNKLDPEAAEKAEKQTKAKSIIEKIMSQTDNKNKKKIFDIFNKTKTNKAETAEQIAARLAAEEAKRLAAAQAGKKPDASTLQAEIDKRTALKAANALKIADKLAADKAAKEAEDAMDPTKILQNTIAARRAALLGQQAAINAALDAGSDSDSSGWSDDDDKGKKISSKDRNLRGKGLKLDKYTIKQLKDFLKTNGAGLHKTIIKEIKEHIKNRKKTGKGIKKLNTKQKKQIILGEIKAGNNNPLLIKMLKK